MVRGYLPGCDTVAGAVLCSAAYVLFSFFNFCSRVAVARWRGRGNCAVSPSRRSYWR